jgi:hypothetical protein
MHTLDTHKLFKGIKSTSNSGSALALSQMPNHAGVAGANPATLSSSRIHFERTLGSLRCHHRWLACRSDLQCCGDFCSHSIVRSSQRRDERSLQARVKVLKYSSKESRAFFKKIGGRLVLEADSVSKTVEVIRLLLAKMERVDEDNKKDKLNRRCRTFRDVCVTSALPLITDSERTLRHVGCGPTTDITLIKA